MSKRKKFGISSELNQGFTDAVSAVEGYSSDKDGRFSVVSLQRIERDPENPRELSITETDLPPNSIAEADPLVTQKKKELEDLSYMATTIKEQGVIQPIIIYKHLEKYRIIAGERRFLASVLAGKTDIQARIYDKKPSSFNVRLLQWIENNSREGLSLKDKIKNIQQITHEYLSLNSDNKLTVRKLAELINVSKTLAHRYFSLLNAPKDIKEVISSGKLNSLKVVSFLVTIKSDLARTALIEAAIDGATLAKLKELDIKNKNIKKETTGRGRVRTKVDFGHTKNPTVAKIIVEAILNESVFSEFKVKFTGINWSDLEAANEAFKALLGILEEKV